MSDLIQLAARLRVDTEHVDGWVIATCPLLYVVTQGNSVTQALERIREEIEALFAFAVERGVLHQMIQHRINLNRLDLTQDADGEARRETHWVDLKLPIEAIRELSKAA